MMTYYNMSNKNKCITCGLKKRIDLFTISKIDRMTLTDGKICEKIYRDNTCKDCRKVQKKLLIWFKKEQNKRVKKKTRDLLIEFDD